MADKTKIEWTDATVNAVNGCSVVSPGCTNCYAMRLAGTRMREHPTRKGLTIDSKAGPVWNGEIRVNEKAMLQPLRWAKPRMCFWNAHGDLFHPAVPDAVIDRCFAVMALTPHHMHQVLTKRSARMREYMLAFEDRPEAMGAAFAHVVRAAGMPKQAGLDAIDAMMFPLPNVWLGVSVEDQQRADERVPDLLATPAAVRWLSCEPLLGPVDLSRLMFVERECPNWEIDGHQPIMDPETGARECCFHCDFTGVVDEAAIDWIVVGGESGPGARPMHPDWARSLRDQCSDAGVPFLFKQWGAWAPLGKARPATCGNAAWPDGSVGVGNAADHGGEGEAIFTATKAITGRLLDGVQHDGYPIGLVP